MNLLIKKKITMSEWEKNIWAYGGGDICIGLRFNSFPIKKEKGKNKEIVKSREVVTFSMKRRI